MREVVLKLLTVFQQAEVFSGPYDVIFGITPDPFVVGVFVSPFRMTRAITSPVRPNPIVPSVMEILFGRHHIDLLACPTGMGIRA